MSDDLATLAALIAQPGQPETLFKAFEEATRFITEWVPGLQPVQLAATREMLIGIALILVLHLKPQGILPERIPKAPAPPTTA